MKFWILILYYGLATNFYLTSIKINIYSYTLFLKINNALIHKNKKSIISIVDEMLVILIEASSILTLLLYFQPQNSRVKIFPLKVKENY